jgi:hypothetical protein
MKAQREGPTLRRIFPVKISSGLCFVSSYRAGPQVSRTLELEIESESHLKQENMRRDWLLCIFKSHLANTNESRQ